MKIEISPQRLAKVRWHEYLARFVFGGMITALTGWMGHRYGPVVGGLFLAFPAILPAAVTLIQRHDHSRQAAGVDAAGAVFGAAGLLGFGALVWRLGTRLAAGEVLSLAAIVWFVMGIGFWYAHRSLTHRRSRSLRDTRFRLPQ